VGGVLVIVTALFFLGGDRLSGGLGAASTVAGYTLLKIGVIAVGIVAVLEILTWLARLLHP
jgi:hypothetical protein